MYDYRTMKRTLAEAVENARAASIIEIRGNGPFPLYRLLLGTKALTLRAAAGSDRF